jgi:hypothetical protein
MKRRTVLATVGGALLASAGCVSNASSQDPAQGDEPEDNTADNGSVDDAADNDSRGETPPEQTPVDGTPNDNTPATDSDEGDDTVETLAITIHNVSGSRFGFKRKPRRIPRPTVGGVEADTQ